MLQYYRSFFFRITRLEIVSGLSMKGWWGQYKYLPITDRHKLNTAWIKRNLPNTTHYFDIWHVSKGTCVTCSHRACQQKKMSSLATKFSKELGLIYWISKYTSLAYPGLCKKIDKLAKPKKDYDKVGEWRQSISNQMYWCAASTHGGNDQVIQEKWKMLPLHIQNTHVNVRVMCILNVGMATCKEMQPIVFGSSLV